MMMMSNTNEGVSHHMAGALLAMEHFNSRNTAVVPELADYLISPSSADDDDSDGDEYWCNVRFDMNSSTFFDTGSVTHLAATSLVVQKEPTQAQGPLSASVCAIVGPYHDLPARDLSILVLAV
jgi:hypothetical protein